MQNKTIKGQCLCGSVTLSLTPKSESFDACHCGMCRTWGGNSYMTVAGGKDVEVTGKDFIAAFSSSKWAERGFCKQCGTHLFYRMKGTGEHYVPFGLLKGTENFKFTKQIFIDRKPASYNFAEATEKLTEAEVFAKES